MLPLFKSHYSVGKSILTLNSPSTDDSDGACSVFDISSKHDLSHIFLVEDSLIGFLEAHKQSQSLGVHLSFGLRMTMCDDMSVAPKRNSTASEHKIIVFALNGEGCVLLNKIYSAAQTKGHGRIDSSCLKDLYDPKLLQIAIPFYDSFLFENTFSYKEPCFLDHSFFTPTFFIENNLHPFDGILEDAVWGYAKNEFPVVKVKSIYYENREDFEAYQTYKCICGRGFSTRAKTLDMPNLDHCGSPEFCFESYLENESS
tara:strand:+ start:536 stop:1306 length:771 start_codon:yes stop_codon:yes gene_type:complete